MKSIKPGRGPSKMSAVASVFVAIFGVFWCIVAGFMGAWFMIPFGLIFIGFAIYNAKYHFDNAKSEERYSVFDIVDSDEEADPLNKKYGKPNENEDAHGSSAEYCPYCGNPTKSEYDFCPKCGKKLPD